MDILSYLLIGGVGFGRNLIGIIFRPYETYRRIVEHGNLFEIIYVAGCLTFYFAIASLVKTASFRPFLLTAVFMKLAFAAAGSFLVAVAILWLASRLVGGRGTLRGLALGWAYTLIPTLLWFLTTSLLYVLLPPPRTPSFLGVLFSLIYLVFSTTLFFWKVTLAYLTLRFGMRLDLPRILLVAGASLPFVAIYSFGMYRLGVFRVPFL